MVNQSKKEINNIKKVNNKNNNTKKIKVQKNGFNSTEVIFLIVITCIISLVMGWCIGKRMSPNSEKKLQKFVKDNDLNEFVRNYNYILENYDGEIDSKTLLEGATEGMLNKLDDDFSTVIPENLTNSFNIMLDGKYQGIGVRIINNEQKNIIIYNVIKNSPAEKAGLKSGDIIIKINDKDFTGKEVTDVANYIQQSQNNNFKILVKRDGIEKEFQIKRNEVTLESVESKIIKKDDKKIGYIYITIFANNTYNQFKKELSNLEKEKINSLIIDVRDDTGGHLTTVSKMLSLFLDNTHVIYQIQKKDDIKKYYSTGNETKKYKIIVLQNKNSASASELLSATLKEEYGATVVGTNSYGKATVQELITTPSGNEYKFTTKKWLTPKGEWINKKGVVPDIEVKLSEEYIKNPTEENDNQLKTALEEAAK